MNVKEFATPAQWELAEKTLAKVAETMTPKWQFVDPRTLAERLAVVQVVYNEKPLARLGQARYRANVLELHGMYQRVEFEPERDRTFLHEIAHFVAHFNGVSDGHGRNWKQVMRIMGQPVERCAPATSLAVKELTRMRAEREKARYEREKLRYARFTK